MPLEYDGTDEANEMGACAEGTYVRHAVLDYYDVMVRRFEVCSSQNAVLMLHVLG